MRSAARWALDRPVRLAAVAAATVAAAVVLGMCSADPDPHAGADAKPTPAPTAPSSTPPSTAPAPADVDTADPAAVASTFVGAWAAGRSLSDPADPDQWAKWYARVGQHCTDRCGATLASVDPARVPATRVTGDARVTYDRDTRHEVAVPTDAGEVSVRLVRDAPTDPWRVESWEQGAQAEPGR
ncbi:MULTISPECIES: hypothetical protein [Streptomyces]|uniref:hypothetical protein n=1 Tax=Streptomyces TaxID=1883 RepID=UPI00096AE733|nr:MULTISPECIES: hypothetical protein [Streptomyces]KAF0794749.1 hypothetical protein P405_17750 [Streptomyces sp. FR-008]MCX4468391.1 hypothetical protein [Streptomyces albidoflavus]WSI90327.1 hypothetical protein OG695_00025 [Streptomyces albidoflavus]